MKHEPTVKKSKLSGSDEWEYRDGDVFAVMSTDKKTFCQIHEFSSHEPGKGNGRAAVEWLKRKYGQVHINDPGNEIDTPEAFEFWKKLAEKSLIHSMIDGDGNVIFNEGKWVSENIEAEDYPSLYSEITSPSMGI